MTVEVLRLSGMKLADADREAGEMLDLRTGPRDLRYLLVVDDTDLLGEHAPVYMRIDTSKRVAEMLCVAVGPRTGDDRVLRLPGNLGGGQGSPVLWVSDPLGIDWRVAAAAIALGHLPGKVTGLDHLMELLTVQDMFRRVHKVFVERVPGRVASPGLRLAGQDDEAATFAAALAVAIQALCGPGSGADGAFGELLPAQAGGASLDDNGPLVRYRDEVAEASDASGGPGGLGGRFRRGSAGLQARIVETGAALADLRDLVAQLLRSAQASGDLTDNQRRLIAEAGVRFPPAPRAPASGRPGGPGADQPLVYRTVMRAVQGGDTLALVARRLTLTERELKRRGSASYLPQVDERCPQPLLDRLAQPPERLPRRADTAEARQELGLDDAVRSARALTDLVVAVANREWSPACPSRGEVARIRVALDGACAALTEHAARVSHGEGRARGARLTRLGEFLLPMLRDLVIRVLAAESAQPSASGPEAFGAARDRVARLVAEWVQHVQGNGVSSPPPFATPGSQGLAPFASDDDVAEIRDALLYQPAGEMWQLCAPEDLGVLNITAVPEAVRFASRLSKDALAGTIPGDEPVWTSSGSHAGLLRLVSLRRGFVSSSWGEPAAAESSP